MRITVVYDNESLKKDLRANWGFSALIDQDILFDTGGSSTILLGDMRKLGIDPQEIRYVVLSHAHWDPTGGLSGLLEENSDVRIYVISRLLLERLERSVPEKAEVIKSDTPTKVREGATTTGALGILMKEQGLVCSSGEGSFLILGCSHPGVGNLLDAASKIAEITGVIGGFHGFSKLNALKDLEMIIPCHCTQRKKEIEERFPGKHVKCGAGMVIENGKVKA